jgi:hypothetical protein
MRRTAKLQVVFFYEGDHRPDNTAQDAVTRADNRPVMMAVGSGSRGKNSYRILPKAHSSLSM